MTDAPTPDLADRLSLWLGTYANLAVPASWLRSALIDLHVGDAALTAARQQADDYKAASLKAVDVAQLLCDRLALAEQTIARLTAERDSARLALARRQTDEGTAKP